MMSSAIPVTHRDKHQGLIINDVKPELHRSSNTSPYLLPQLNHPMILSSLTFPINPHILFPQIKGFPHATAHN